MIKIIDGIDENGKSKKFRLEIPMKYIRTKDKVKLREYKLLEESIVKEADTIEELCDEIVCKFKKGKEKPFITVSVHNFYPYIDVVRERIQGVYNDQINIFGSIWTKWGLRYIAKVKGILPSGEIDWELI